MEVSSQGTSQNPESLENPGGTAKAILLGLGASVWTWKQLTHVNLLEPSEAVWGRPGSKNFQIAGPIMNRISRKPTRFSVKNKEEW